MNGNGTLILIVAGGILLACLLGTIIRGRRLTREAESLRVKLARSESLAREQGRLVAKMRAEGEPVSNLARSLPSVVREVTRRELDPRSIPPLILSLAQGILHPTHMLLYQARVNQQAGESGGTLELVAHHGYVEIPKALKKVRIGEGKIGWVAEHKLDMVREDWRKLDRSERSSIEDNHPTARLDVVGPLLQTHERGEDVLGVLCIGTAGARHENEKLLFQLVTNLGSLALVNASRVLKLRDLANTDGLTGLLNKRYFRHELSKIIYESERQAQHLSLFIFDIDHFKTYNDTNGHLEGDRVLRQLAALVKTQVRSGDRCCRYGGEEFIVAMPNTDSDAAFEIAERIRRTIEQFAFENEEAQPNGNVTISGGLATSPADGNLAEVLTENADKALYQSKRAGRNRTTRFVGIYMGEETDDTAIDLERAPLLDSP